MQRIDGVVRPPGLIRSAKTYSLFIDQGTLYAIVTGPGTMNVGTMLGSPATMVAGEIVKGPITNAIAKKRAPAITAAEAVIDPAKLPELAKIKHNFAIPFGAMTYIEVGTHPVQGPYLELKAGKEKLVFYFRDKTQAEVETLAKSFGQTVTVK